MQLNSQVQPIYLPESGQTTVLRLGLQHLDPRHWIIADADFCQFHTHKLDARENYGDRVYQALPDSQAAQQEFRELLLSHLLTDHAVSYSLDGSMLCFLPANLCWSLNDVSLWHTSLWVQEDICIMEKTGEDYCLTAASVCSPSNWKLEEKMGQSLDRIHAPVPEYDRQLSDRVKRLFDNIKPGKPVLRYNWSVQNYNDLHWRSDLEPDAQSHTRYWRVERQAISRLPRSGAIVFTIRLFLHSFEKLGANPDFMPAFQAILADLPENQKNYKGLINSDQSK